MDTNVEPEAKARIQADWELLKNRVLTLKLETPVQFQEVLIDDLVFTAFWLWWWNNSAEESARANWHFAPRVGESDWGGVVQYRY